MTVDVVGTFSCAETGGAKVVVVCLEGCHEVMVWAVWAAGDVEVTPVAHGVDLRLEAREMCLDCPGSVSYPLEGGNCALCVGSKYLQFCTGPCNNDILVRKGKFVALMQ